MQRTCLMMLAAAAILVLSTADANAQGPVRNAWRRITGRNNVATTTYTTRSYTTASRDRIFFDGERDLIGRRFGGRTTYASNSGRWIGSRRAAPATTVAGGTRVDPNVAPASATEDANTNPARRTPATPATPPRQ